MGSVNSLDDCEHVVSRVGSTTTLLRLVDDTHLPAIRATCFIKDPDSTLYYDNLSQVGLIKWPTGTSLSLNR
jgi:hypothetical protein